MSKFKVGDRVVLVKSGYSGDAYLNQPGTVIHTMPGALLVHLDSGVKIRYEPDRFMPAYIWESPLNKALS